MSKKLTNDLYVLLESLADWITNVNPKVVYFCRGCHKRLSKRFTECPFCGFRGRDINMLARDGIKIEESSFGIRQKRIGFPKFIFELVKRYKSSGDKRLPEGIYEERIIDKQKDSYDQTVYKIKGGKVGKILHKDKMKLSEH